MTVNVTGVMMNVSCCCCCCGCEDTGVTVNAVSPGVVRTDIHRHMPFRQSTLVSLTFAPFMWFLMKTASDGAQTIIHCAAATELDGVSGKCFA